MNSRTSLLPCICLAAILVGCGTEPGSVSTSVPPSPTQAEQTQSTPPAVITSAPQSASTSEPLRSITPVPATSQPRPASPTPLPTLPPAPQGASGIEGQTLIGPTCPVERPDSSCADKPYHATIVVLNQNGTEVKRFDTNADGLFRVELPPGTYTLAPQSPGRLPRAEMQTVQVTSGQFTSITITYDSGIR
jgi:hypothetical protein